MADTRGVAFGHGTRTALAVAAVALAAATASAPAAGADSRILFSSAWSRTAQLYAATPDGGRVAQLTFGPYSFCPEWKACGRHRPMPSPDGRRLLFTGSGEPNGTARLFVARADGTGVRQVWKTRRLSLEPRWAPDSRQFAFLDERDDLYVGAVGKLPRLVGEGVDRFAWSASGSLAFTTNRGLFVARRSAVRSVFLGQAPGVLAWAPDGKRLAYSRGEEIVVSGDGGPRVVGHSRYVYALAWSPSGRFLAYTAYEVGVVVVDVRTGDSRAVSGGAPLAWAPRRDVLALDADIGVKTFDATTSSERVVAADQPVELVWAPDGGSIAYVAALDPTPTSVFPALRHPLYYAGDLKVVVPGRVPRTVVHARGAYGGAREIAWTRPVGAHYRRASARTIATVAPASLEAPWPIVNLEADGRRIAYQTCNHVFVWTPSSGDVEQAELVASAEQLGCGPWYEAYRLFDLTIAGDRVAHGASAGNMGQTFWLGGVTIGQPGHFSLGRGLRSAGSPTRGAVGELAGSGDLLVFSEWDERLVFDAAGRASAVPTHQVIRRVENAGCPCPVIAEAAGRLVPLDVDGGRILVSHEYALAIHDRDGAITLSVPPARAAALSGRDLVVVDGAVLRAYDASTGAVLHEWPLGTSSTGRRCSNPGFWCSDVGDLLLEDVARGRVAYVYGNSVHVLRLVDGRDDIIAAGTLAAFSEDGLVYANGNRLTLVPFAQLP